jgi:hypothetical protein
MCPRFSKFYQLRFKLNVKVRDRTCGRTSIGIRRRSDHREKLPRCLLEGHPDLLILAPDNATGDACVVLLKGKVEPFGDVEWISNIEGRPRN